MSLTRMQVCTYLALMRPRINHTNTANGGATGRG